MNIVAQLTKIQEETKADLQAKTGIERAYDNGIVAGLGMALVLFQLQDLREKDRT